MTPFNLLLVFFIQHSGSDTSSFPKQSILFVNEKPIPSPSNQLLLIIPPPTQGFFCNFEDQIQRKKVPVDFGLKLK